MSDSNEVALVQLTEGTVTTAVRHVHDCSLGWCSRKAGRLTRLCGDKHPRLNTSTPGIILAKVGGTMNTSAQACTRTATDVYKSRYKEKYPRNVKKKVAAEVMGAMPPEAQDLHLLRQTLRTLQITPTLSPVTGILDEGPGGTPTRGRHRMVGAPNPNKMPWRATSPTPLEKSCKWKEHIPAQPVTQARPAPAHRYNIFTSGWRRRGNVRIRGKTSN